MTQISNIDGKIFLALKDRLDDWTECSVYVSPDVPQTPGTTSPYVIVSDVRLDTDTRYTGASDVDEYRGVLNLSVMAPMAWTSAQGLGLCGRIADHFDKGAWYAYSDCRVQIMKRPRVIGTAYVDHGMQRYQVQVMWRAVG